MGAINVLATYVALLLMDKCGRRTLIMWSSAGMFVSCIVIVLSLKGYFSKIVALGAVASYVSFFEIGLGPIPVCLLIVLLHFYLPFLFALSVCEHFVCVLLWRLIHRNICIILSIFYHIFASSISG